MYVLGIFVLLTIKIIQKSPSCESFLTTWTFFVNKNRSLILWISFISAFKFSMIYV